MKENTRVLVALGAALLGGVIIAASGNEALMRASEWVVPIGTLWINAIRMTIIPLVVSLLITGVSGAADMRAIGRNTQGVKVMTPSPGARVSAIGRAVAEQKEEEVTGAVPEEEAGSEDASEGEEE